MKMPVDQLNVLQRAMGIFIGSMYFSSLLCKQNPHFNNQVKEKRL
ncbi:MAG: hypothetical protein ACI4AH_06365 [Muribaculaceae bacterium]